LVDFGNVTTATSGMNNFSWISGYVEYGKAFKGVKDLLPDVFSQYFLIPWAVGIIDSFPFTEYPDNKDTIESLNKQHDIEKSFGVFLNHDIKTQYRKTSLKEIAERFNVEYCADTLYLINETPGICLLHKPTEQGVMKLIWQLQKGQCLNLYVEDDYRFRSIDGQWRYSKENVQISVSDYITYHENTSWDSTCYLFPDNRDWCLCTLEDYPHFIFCCNNLNSISLGTVIGMEMFDIEYGNRINWD
jgi:hypothetical protein